MHQEHDCQNCQRHADQHQDLFELLTPHQRGDVQVMLCRGCPGDPFEE